MPKSTAKKMTVNFVALTLLFVVSCNAADQNFDKLLNIAFKKFGITGREIVLEWKQLLSSARTKTDIAQLLDINDFFNSKVVFTTDAITWGLSDYWATPLETMGKGQGDCEDFSIAKYISLLQIGIPLEKLRLIYVKAKLPSGSFQAHMVLAYYSKPGAEPLILDNLSKKIMPASKRPDLVPVFSFNSAGLWAGNGTQPKINKPETRLSRWRDVLVRMQTEGIY